MSTDIQRHDSNSSPTLDEGYWQALLQEGEHSATAAPEHHAGETQEVDDFHTEDIEPVYEPLEESREDWNEIVRVSEADEVIELQVTGYNRGGLLVEWNTLRGFVPASQLIDFPVNSGPLRRDALVSYMGKTLQLRVIELNIDKNRLILSERAAMAAAGRRETILTTLDVGDVVGGCVTNLCEFGAFVDLGGLEGLIHISELSWGRVGHPSHMLKRGQHIEAYVLGVDPDAGRVALSIKRLRPDPWQTVEERYQCDQVVEGVITNVVDFGAFACIEEGLEGLIHVSELAEGHFLHPRNVVSEGQRVKARILTINGQARRLGLSLRITP